MVTVKDGRVRWNGGRINAQDLYMISNAATRLRMSPLGLMVAVTKEFINNGGTINKPEPTSAVNNRRTTIKKHIQAYLDVIKERDILFGETYLLRQRIAELTAGSKDNFMLFTTSAEYHELVHELAVAENRLAHPDMGSGILQDISNLLSDDRTIPDTDVGSDTHFLLSTPDGTLPVPFKIRDSRVWLGSLPKGSVVIINNLKVVI